MVICFELNGKINGAGHFLQNLKRLISNMGVKPLGIWPLQNAGFSPSCHLHSLDIVKISVPGNFCAAFQFSEVICVFSFFQGDSHNVSSPSYCFLVEKSA